MEAGHRHDAVNSEHEALAAEHRCAALTAQHTSLTAEHRRTAVTTRRTPLAAEHRVAAVATQHTSVLPKRKVPQPRPRRPLTFTNAITAVPLSTEDHGAVAWSDHATRRGDAQTVKD